MAAILLALASSLTWGVADFSGGMLARRLPLAAVTIFEEIGGLILLAAFVAERGGLDWHSVWVGAIGGVGGGIGVAYFYAALARGTMSIVSPLVACSAVVPVGLALGTGERPSALVLGGSAVALAGAVLASAEERSRAKPAGDRRSGSPSPPRSGSGSLSSSSVARRSMGRCYRRFLARELRQSWCFSSGSLRPARLFA